MANSRIEIIVSERGSRVVKRKLQQLGQEGEVAASRVNLLKNALLSLGVGIGLSELGRQLFSFSNALQEVSTLVDTSVVSMNELNRVALSQARTFGSMPTAQAQALYQIISAGASDAATATLMLNAANNLALGGVTDVLTAADGLTSVMNAYGEAITSAADASDIMFTAVRAGKTTIGELSTSIGVVAPLAASAGISFEELAASAAALTKGGVTTNVAMTGLRAIMASILKPSSEASAMAQKLGIDFSAAALETQGLAGFMQELNEKTQGNPAILAELFGGVEALVPVMALLKNDGAALNDVLAMMGERAGATADAVAKMEQSPIFQGKRVMAAFVAEVIELGQQLLGVLTPAMRILADNMQLIFNLGKIMALAFAWRIVATAAVTNLIGPILALRTAFGTTTAASITFSIAIGAARTAVNSLTAALLANPFTALAVAILAIVSAIIQWGDQMSLTEDGVVSLKDAFFATLSLIGDLVGEVGTYISSTFGVAFDFIQGLLNDWGTSFGEILDWVAGLVKSYANYQIGTFVAAYTIIKEAWNNFPGVMDVIFTAIINLAAKAAEAVLNAWQAPLRIIAAGLSYVDEEASAGLNGFLNNFNMRVPRAQLSDAGRQAGEALQTGLASAFNTDYLGAAWTAIEERARASKSTAEETIAATQAIAQGGGIDGLSGVGSGSGRTSAAEAARKTLEDRASLLAEIVKSTRDATTHARNFNAEQAAVDDELFSINRTLEQRGFAGLMEEEQNQLAGLIGDLEDAENAQRNLQRAYDDIVTPQRDYYDQLEAINEIMELYPEHADRAAEALYRLQAAELARQNTLSAGIELGRLDVQGGNQFGGADRIAGLYSSQYGAANDPLRDFTEQAQVLQQLMQDDPINSGQYRQSLQDLGLEFLQFKATLPDATIFDGFTAGFAKFAEDFRGIIPGLNQAWGNFFTSFANGAANSIGRAIAYGESLGSALNDVVRQALSGLISSLVQLGLQWLVMQVIGKAAMSSITATSAGAGAATAAAWAPAAAMVSLATFGANAGPATAGIAITTALTSALSQVGSIAGAFKDGGFIHGAGGPRSDNMLAAVSPGEFVMNATSTRRFLPMLEAMNMGHTPSFKDGGMIGGAIATNITPGATGALNVVVEDHVGADIKVERAGPNEVRIIAREEAEKAVAEKSGDAVAKDLAQPNSKVNRALQRNTTTRPRRGQ